MSWQRQAGMPPTATQGDVSNELQQQLFVQSMGLNIAMKAEVMFESSLVKHARQY